jgi:uncharacterized membrane protein YqhA
VWTVSISQTRYMVIVAVVASLALAATLFLFGAVAAARIIAGTVGALGDAKQTKAFAIASVEIFSSQRPGNDYVGCRQWCPCHER